MLFFSCDQNGCWQTLKGIAVAQDLDKDEDIPAPYKAAPEKEVRALAAEYAARRKKIDAIKSRQLGTHGFEAEAAGEVIFP